MKKVFISYRRRDSSWASQKFAQSLEVYFSKENIFIDVDSVPIGVDFVETMLSAVSDSDIFFLMIGKDWLNYKESHSNLSSIHNPKNNVRLEILAALDQDVQIVPILIDGAEMPDEAYLPDELKKIIRFNAEFISQRNFENDVSRILFKTGRHEKLKKPSSQSKLIAIILLTIIILTSIYPINLLFDEYLSDKVGDSASSNSNDNNELVQTTIQFRDNSDYILEEENKKKVFLVRDQVKRLIYPLDDILVMDFNGEETQLNWRINEAEIQHKIDLDGNGYLDAIVGGWWGGTLKGTDRQIVLNFGENAFRVIPANNFGNNYTIEDYNGQPAIKVIGSNQLTYYGIKDGNLAEIFFAKRANVGLLGQGITADMMDSAKLYSSSSPLEIKLDANANERDDVLSCDGVQVIGWRMAIICNLTLDDGREIKICESGLHEFFDVYVIRDNFNEGVNSFSCGNELYEFDGSGFQHKNQ